MKSSETVFLICSERSGSNLITKLLDAHPDFCGPTPLHLMRIFSNNLFRYGNLAVDACWRELLDDLVAIIDTQLGKWCTQWTVEKLLAGVKERRLAALIDHIYAAERDACGKKHLFIKENRIHTFLPFIFANYPRAKFLYLVRDPRDMALSWKLSKNHPGGVVKAAEIWQEDQRRSIELMGYLGPDQRIMALRYEDLLQFPEASARRICRFLNIDHRDEMFRFHENGLTVQNANRLADWGNLKRPLMTKNFNKYKKNLAPMEIRYLETVCREAMAVFGYAFEFAPDTLPWSEVQRQVAAIEAEAVENPPSIERSEKAIRERRLAVIRKIIARNNFDLIDVKDA